MMRRRDFLALTAGLPLAVCAWADEAAGLPPIRVNQAGYLPEAAKLAMVVHPRASRFIVRDAVNGTAVLQGRLSAARADANSGDSVQVADFSALHRPGRYRIEVPGVGQSWNFAIAPDVYDHVWYLAMRAYYGQRCGCEVDLGPTYPAYRHAACHRSTGFDPSSGRGGAPHNHGGWHDAGDYGRYSVNAGVSTSTLLWAFERYRGRLEKRKLDLPDAHPDLPDMLQEIRWNLDWMLSLQDHDGGVWHKQTSTRFCAFILPEADTLPSEIVGTGAAPYKSTAATADLAATAAIAARVYHAYDRAYAARCLAAAEQAWTWAARNPEVAFRNPAGVSTGEYGDGKLEDELLWAAAELWRTSGKDEYQQYFLQNFRPFLGAEDGSGLANVSWGDVSSLALWTYCQATHAGTRDGVVDDIVSRSRAAADAIAARSARDGYRVSLRARDYIWGSNGVAGNYALQLLLTDHLAGTARYRETVLDQLHYLLGRNTFSLSYVTHVGEHAFQHPHHRPSAADDVEAPWPGLLSGGPNAHPADPVAVHLPQQPPARMYTDATMAYSVNEIAINWNAPLVFLLSALI